MNNNIYIIYDPEKENEKSLNDFKQVMIKAGYPLDKIITLSSIQFDEYMERKEILPFVLCLNSTFKDYCIKYSDILEVPVFEFFSKDYHDVSKNIHIAGILLDIKDIFQISYKRYAWKILTEFYNFYKDSLIEQEDTPTVDETVKECSPCIVEVYEEIEKSEISSSEIINDIAVPETVNLKEFYLNVKNLMNQMNIVQEQIKHLDQQFNNEK